MYINTDTYLHTYIIRYMAKYDYIYNMYKMYANNIYCIIYMYIYGYIVEFSSVAQSCPALCDPTDCSMPDFRVHHQILE